MAFRVEFSCGGSRGEFSSLKCARRDLAKNPHFDGIGCTATIKEFVPAVPERIIAVHPAVEPRKFRVRVHCQESDQRGRESSVQGLHNTYFDTFEEAVAELDKAIAEKRPGIGQRTSYGILETPGEIVHSLPEPTPRFEIQCDFFAGKPFRRSEWFSEDFLSLLDARAAWKENRQTRDWPQHYRILEKPSGAVHSVVAESKAPWPSYMDSFPAITLPCPLVARCSDLVRHCQNGEWGWVKGLGTEFFSDLQRDLTFALDHRREEKKQ